MNITMMPPYVAPENRELVEKAESTLREYETRLIEDVKKKWGMGPSIQPSQEDIENAQRLFLNDPFRQVLIKSLCNIKILCEMPRFLVTEIKDKD